MLSATYPTYSYSLAAVVVGAAALTQTLPESEKDRPAFKQDIVRIFFSYMPGNSVTTNARLSQLNSIEALGWSTEETLETYLRLRAFAEDWDYPGMEAYDDL